MKKIMACLALAGMIFTFAACGAASSGDTTPSNEIVAQNTVSGPSEILDVLAKEVPFEDHMSTVDGETAIGRYGVDDNYTGECALYISTTATPEEVAVFKMDDSHDAAYFEGVAESYLANQKANYANYAPEHMPKLDSAVVGSYGDYFVVCVSADNAKAASVLDAFMGA